MHNLLLAFSDHVTSLIFMHEFMCFLINYYPIQFSVIAPRLDFVDFVSGINHIIISQTTRGQTNIMALYWFIDVN